MREYLKEYLVAVLISMFFAVLPWGLVILGLDALEIFYIYAWSIGGLGMIIASFYIVRRVKSWKIRILIFSLNPTVYYFLFAVGIAIWIRFFENWDNFMNLGY